MNISEFVAEQNTTIDTVKHYIKLGLLTPSKKNTWYSFSEKEASDFQNINQLKSLGMTLDLIKAIKDQHDYQCGTLAQWEYNLSRINEQLAKVKIEQERLLMQEELLKELQIKLSEKIKDV